MALNGKALQSIMVGQLASKGIVGGKVSDLAGGLSEGLVDSFLAQNTVITSDVGLLPAGAPGVGVGKMIGLDPKAMAGMMLPLVTSEGILGSKSKDLIDGICEAVCTHFLAANLVNTTHPTVVLGSGVGKVTALQASATSAMVSGKLASKGIVGSKMQNLAKGISEGFVNNILATAVINVSIAGAPLVTPGGTVPSGGAGTGKVT